jgi:hypothetical protein
MYWGEENRCHADAILVEIDANQHRDYDMEAGREPYATAEKREVAKSSGETCCYTFRPKKR